MTMTTITAQAPGTAPPSPLVPLGRRLFRIRGWLYLPFALFATFWTRWEWERDAIIWPIGVALLAAGAALRFSAIRRMGGAARTHKDKAKRLVDSGPYAWVRNPLYVANITAFAGFVVLCELPWFAVVSVLLLGAAFHAVARYEETILRAGFGEAFDDYRARVPMWIPRPPREAPVEDPSTFYPVEKILRRERGALANIALFLCLAVAKEFLAHQ